MRKLADRESFWDASDCVNVKAESLFRYLGTVKSLKIKSHLPSDNLILEVLNAVSDQPVAQGDLVTIANKEKDYLYPIQNSVSN